MRYNTTMEDLKKIVGNNIALLRKNYKLTQIEFAEKLNYSDKSVSKWERGEALPDVYVLKQIADFFSVSVDTLLKEYKSDKALLNKSKKYKATNRLIISLISAGGCWVIATLIFILLCWSPTPISRPWLVFLWCADVSLLILFIFSAIWGGKILMSVTLSLLLWYFITSIFITVSFNNKWLIYILGIPVQIIIILSFLISKRKVENKKNDDNIMQEVSEEKDGN